MASSGKVNLLGKREAKDDDVETKPILKKHKDKSEETTKRFPEIKGRVELLETKSDQAPVKAVPSRQKTLYVTCLSPQTKISDIIDFFKDVGRVVIVKLAIKCEGKRPVALFSFLLLTKQRRRWIRRRMVNICVVISLFLAWLRKKFHKPSIAYITRFGTKTTFNKKAFRLKKRRHLTPPYFIEAVAVRKKTLFVANLSAQTKISHIFDFFNDVGQVVSVRLIVNPEGKHVGYGFVEFASPCLANMALEKKNGEYLHDHKIFLGVAKTAPHPPRRKYNLAEKLWYEDYLLQESFQIEEDEAVEGLDENPSFVEAVSLREKTLFVAHLSRQTKISDIINFFKDVGQVVHVRLIIDHKGKHAGYGFVEFTSADEAKKVRLVYSNDEKCFTS